MGSTVQVLITLIIMIQGSLSTTQNIREDGNTLILATVLDTLNTLSRQIQGLEAKLGVIQESQVTIEEKIERQEEKIDSFQQCSSRDQLLDFQNLLQTDECKDGRHNNCSEVAMCTDNLVGYTCKCSPGYAGDGFTCQDVDECNEENITCQANEVCSNNPGSYSCVCEEGYRRRGNTCGDVNECFEKNFTCQPNEVCSNNPGSYICVCEEGYRRIGNTCEVSDCKPPSLQLQDLGCITLLDEREMTWNEAKMACQQSNGRLVENVRIEHMEPLQQHFHAMMVSYRGAWIGFKQSQWLSSGDYVDIDLFASEEYDEYECGIINLHSETSPGINDAWCPSTTFALCQSLN